MQFLPALFGNESVDNTRRRLACLPVKCTGVALPDATKTAEQNRTASTIVCGHIVAALRGNEIFRSPEHKTIMSAGKAEIRKRNVTRDEGQMESILSGLPD
jgi:hypothetical protein